MTTTDTIEGKHDFSGLATAYEIPCEDNRVIRKGTFDHQDGQRVPLVWRHNHDDLDNVLGHAILRVNEEPPGIRAFAKLNDTPNGKRAKVLIKNGDISALSIWANQLKESVMGAKRYVSHGQIRELSLVLSGKNRGAFIDEVLMHSADGYEEFVEDSAYIGSGFEIEIPEPEEIIEHESDDAEDEKKGETLGDVLETFNERERVLLSALLAHEAGAFEDDFELTDIEEDGEAPDIDLDDMEEVYNSLSDKKKRALLIVVEDFTKEVSNIKHESEEDQTMTQDIFNSKGTDKEDGVLTHEAVQDVLSDAMTRRPSSLKQAFLEHGITDIETLFPDHKVIGGAAPDIFKDEDSWVSTVMNGVHKSPFARTKTRYADLTGEEARARGYIKGNEKLEEVFPVLQRTTDPQTVYKKQQLDRDDIVDITEFDVVAWLKQEMRMMLRAELARQILVGDGRSAMSPDYIDPTKIRPIWTDHEVYSEKIVLEANTPVDEQIDAVVRAHVDYQGTGRPTFFASPQVIVEMLLLKDLDGRRIYPTRQTLAAALDVADIVDVPVMKNLTRNDGVDDLDLVGIVVNLRDYNLGMDRMGQTAFFDDFDIDFNQYKYLYESRQSGALIRPKSAIVIEMKQPVG
jgi:HK97 family phage prohead protease